MKTFITGVIAVTLTVPVEDNASHDRVNFAGQAVNKADILQAIRDIVDRTQRDHIAGGNRLRAGQIQLTEHLLLRQRGRW